ncbi:MAG TPA: hypothetical protein VEA59_01295 [Patescibacteria group bacterium]|nr:hypothetical protein [Patescibacteria group bacterium]
MRSFITRLGLSVVIALFLLQPALAQTNSFQIQSQEKRATQYKTNSSSEDFSTEKTYEQRFCEPYCVGPRTENSVRDSLKTSLPSPQVLTFGAALLLLLAFLAGLYRRTTNPFPYTANPIPLAYAAEETHMRSVLQNSTASFVSAIPKNGKVYAPTNSLPETVGSIEGVKVFYNSRIGDLKGLVKYQCKDLITRYVLTIWKDKYPDDYKRLTTGTLLKGNAASFVLGHVDKSDQGNTYKDRGLRTFQSGKSKELPTAGDFMAGVAGFGRYGHIMIATNTVMETPKKGYVEVVEQNFTLSEKNGNITNRNGVETYQPRKVPFTVNGDGTLNFGKYADMTWSRPQGAVK